MKLYNELAEYYYAIEKHHRNFHDDINLIQSLIHYDYNIPILDIGCGSGEHIGYLSENGYKCIGLDLSNEILNVAQKRNKTNIKYINQNMTDFDFFQDFGLIICMFGSFNYLLSDEDVNKTLWNCWRALKSGGTCLLEIWNSSPLLKIQEKKTSHVSVTLFNGAKIDRERGFKLKEKDPYTIVEVNYKYNIFGNSELKYLDDKHIMRAYSCEEINKLIKKNGFKIIHRYSNSKKNQFHQDSNKQILIIKKL